MSSYPTYARVLDLLVGLALVILGSWVVIDGSLAEAIILIIFSIGLILIGLTRIVKGATMKELKSMNRAIHIVTGLLALVLAAVVLVFPAFGTGLLISVVAIGLFFTGIARILIFYSEAEMSLKTRAFHLVVGALATGIPILILIVPGLGFLTLFLFASITFIIVGAARIVSGIFGDV